MLQEMKLMIRPMEYRLMDSLPLPEFLFDGGDTSPIENADVDAEPEAVAWKIRIKELETQLESHVAQLSGQLEEAHLQGLQQGRAEIEVEHGAQWKQCAEALRS